MKSSLMQNYYPSLHQYIKLLKVFFLLRESTEVDGLMEYYGLEPGQGEEYWDAFSDLCLMAPKAVITGDIMEK